MIRLLLLFFPILSYAVYFPAPPRGSIAPYISGDTFRAKADFAYDELMRSFIPSSVKKGDTIFVNGDLLASFFQTMHPRIPHPYILITHNSDQAIPGPFSAYLNDGKILAWFTQNPDGTAHPKFHPIPIGLENRQWKPTNVQTIERIKAFNLPKSHLLYCNFSTTSYLPERPGVHSLFKDLPYVFLSERKDYDPFIEDLARSKFVLCPRGNGLDTHRLWETLYVGSYPVVKTSPLDPLYANLPVLIVNEWTDVTEELLNGKYEEFQSKIYHFENLFTDYWFRQIDACKQRMYTLPSLRSTPEPMTTSVIIPCAAQHFFHLSSLLHRYQKQTVVPDEVVISLSETDRLDPLEVDSLENQPWPFSCRILRHREKKSAGMNRNLACASAMGDLILCQDADDIPHPQRVEVVKYLFENYPILHLIHTYILRKEQIDTYEPIFTPYQKETLPLYSFFQYYDLYKSPVFNDNLHNGNICFLRSVINSVHWDDVFECDHDVKFNRDVYRLFQNHAAVPCDLLIYRPQYSAFNPANNPWE